MHRHLINKLLIVLCLSLCCTFMLCGLFAPTIRAAPRPVDNLPVDKLPPDLTLYLSEIQPLLPSLYLGLRLFPSLPTLLGVHKAQHYLLVIQNSDELRATGGFISAVGLITLDKSKLGELNFMDSYALFRTDLHYPPPPQPLAQFMGIPYLVFRDANWSPDFPTTARLLQSIYHQETGVAVDGIVTIDLHAVELLIAALEPLTLPNVETPLTGENVLAQIKALWTQPDAGGAIDEVGLNSWWVERKAFIPVLAAAVMQKLRSNTIDYVQVGDALQQGLRQRAIQIWLEDKQAAAQLAQLGWDGALQVQPGADYLSLIDTNMGYNKANAAVQQQLAYTVTWPADGGAPLAEVTIDYTHERKVADPGCDLTPRYGSNYDDLVNRCFFNYVRLYTPKGSELLDATGFQADSVQSRRGEADTQVFGGYFILPPGEQTQVRFRYRLPATFTPATYQLVVKRQAGARPLPLTLQINQKQATFQLVDSLLYWQP
jgi:Protein of unknown function (DUF4012)